MATLILNRETFAMPADGWYQIAPLGEFPHAGAGVVQVVDGEACEAMVRRFREEAGTANFAGLLVDFDHFSLDGEKRSEAAGWITGLENRNAGLFAKIRWSDVGEEAVKGGRYRFLSPVWSRGDCEDLGNGRLRPVRLLNAAVTNDPNLKGMRPLSNRGQGSEIGDQPSPRPSPGGRGSAPPQTDSEGKGSAPPQPARFKWVLGAPPSGRHCPSCLGLAGQVHTMAEWEKAGVKPGSGDSLCGGRCYCSLQPTTEAENGKIGEVRMRKPAGDGDKTANRKTEGTGGQRSEVGSQRTEGNGVLANVGWTDEARAAALAVRRAKAAARKAAQESAAPTGTVEVTTAPEMSQEEEDVNRLADGLRGYRVRAMDAFRADRGRDPETPEELAEGEALAGVPAEYRTNGRDIETDEQAREILAGESKSTGGNGVGGSRGTDALEWFEEEGFREMSHDAVTRLTDELRGKLARNPNGLTAAEEGFLSELGKSGFAGESDGDPVFQWMERESMRESGPDAREAVDSAKRALRGTSGQSARAARKSEGSGAARPGMLPRGPERGYEPPVPGRPRQGARPGGGIPPPRLLGEKKTARRR